MSWHVVAWLADWARFAVGSGNDYRRYHGHRSSVGGCDHLVFLLTRSRRSDHIRGWIHVMTRR
jgi:hypothetical protein